jgi:hypothetical protein
VGTDPKELSDGLRVLMNLSDGDKNAVGKAAQFFIQENFTWKKIVQNVKVQLSNLHLSSKK